MDSVTPRIVEAVATSAGNGMTGKKGFIAKLVEEVMAQAVRDCYSEGISNDVEAVRERSLAARRAVLDKLSAQSAEG